MDLVAAHHRTQTDGLGCAGRSLRGRKTKSVPERQFCKKTACSSYVQPWLMAIGGWRLATGGGWWLVVGGWWLIAVGSGLRLAVGRRWRGGWRRLVVGGWWSLGAVPKGGPQKKSSPLRTPLGLLGHKSEMAIKK